MSESRSSVWAWIMVVLFVGIVILVQTNFARHCAQELKGTYEFDYRSKCLSDDGRILDIF